jgi:putative ATP-dependent endonuclease of the OLD family
MSGFFDYVLVTAGLRASEEAQKSRSAVSGRFLERTIDRRPWTRNSENSPISTSRGQSDMHERRFGPQLEAISKVLSDAVGVLVRERSIKISAPR